MSGSREGGRGLEQMRHVFVKTGVISQASGSAYVEFDATKVMCGVYGPRQGGKTGTATNDRGRLDVDVKLATFATPGARAEGPALAPAREPAPPAPARDDAVDYQVPMGAC